jgi:O-antigen/teichoic acid export membrane protein
MGGEEVKIANPLTKHHGVLVGNVLARVGGLACVFGATLLLAHNGGPAVVGVYALLHVLPGLVGTITSSGLPVAAPYFLAPGRDGPHVRSTLFAMAVSGGAAGAMLWVVTAPLWGPALFSDLPVWLVMLAGPAVLTRLLVIAAKACSQGTDDLKGSNGIIFFEQFAFLPAYMLLWVAGVHGFVVVVGALLLADTVTGSLAWNRLRRRGFFRGATRPSAALARRIGAYGMRGQVGGLMSQLNLRFDFILLGLFAGPAVLGVYAVASKFAELVRILGMALTYVFYPAFAKDGPSRAIARAGRLIRRAGMLTAGAVIPLWLAAGFVLPAFYGSSFDAAVTPARIILLGLVLDGVAGMIIGLLYGIGRPGLNSWAMAAGLAVTVVLDFLLIPRLGATGAAIASAIAYTTTAGALLWFFWRLQRPRRPLPSTTSAPPRVAIATADEPSVQRLK